MTISFLYKNVITLRTAGFPASGAAAPIPTGPADALMVECLHVQG